MYIMFYICSLSVNIIIIIAVVVVVVIIIIIFIIISLWVFTPMFFPEVNWQEVLANLLPILADLDRFNSYSNLWFIFTGSLELFQEVQWWLVSLSPSYSTVFLLVFLWHWKTTYTRNNKKSLALIHIYIYIYSISPYQFIWLP